MHEFIYTSEPHAFLGRIPNPIQIVEVDHGCARIDMPRHGLRLRERCTAGNCQGNCRVPQAVRCQTVGNDASPAHGAPYDPADSI